jgi:alpha-methylacyl-CoA racemase
MEENRRTMSGPLSGMRIVELAGVGPAPFAGMMLADAGADVVVIDRADRPVKTTGGPNTSLLKRGRRSVVVDLKHPEGIELVLGLAERADGFIEGFRPGVAERLGLGPAECRRRNAKLVYGRMTGWGQEGPMSQAAGHDIDFIALAGALEPIGRVGQAPVPPLNLVGDFGGGGMLLAFGMLAALIHALRSGEGQVVDAAMVDGTALLTTMIHGMRASGMWHDERGTNVLDSGAPFYDVYETADGKFVAVGAVEPKFFAELVDAIGLDRSELPDQWDRATWPATKRRFASIFRTKTRAEWESVFASRDACFAPVLTMGEAPFHPQVAFRETFTEIAGIVQPSPAPRFGATPGAIRRPPPFPGELGDEALVEWGLTTEAIHGLRDRGAIV